MPRTSWRDCADRSIGPDGYALTFAAAPLLLPACPAPQLFWKHRDAGERVACIVDTHPSVARP
jgi:hypothetical protein